MAGHSKWSNIKHKKAKEDARRNKIFNKHIREITVAAREGGGDPDANPRLSMAIDNAKADNVPKDNIERAILKGIGELDDGSGAYEDATYEGYGPGGIAFFVEVTTNNYNRTVGDIRHIFNKFGGNLGQDGSVGYLFNQIGLIKIPDAGLDDEEFMLAAIEAGAKDVEEVDSNFEVSTVREDLFNVRKNLEDEGYEIDNAELIRVPLTEVKADAETATTNLKLMDALEDNDDVSKVFTNMKMDDETLAIAEEL